MEKSFSEKYSNIRSVMLQGGGEKGIQSQHQKGKLTCRERIDLLVDEGSFIEDQAYVLGRASDFGPSTYA